MFPHLFPSRVRGCVWTIQTYTSQYVLIHTALGFEDWLCFPNNVRDPVMMWVKDLRVCAPNYL